MSLTAQRGRIAAFTAAALLTLFAGQPLHGNASIATGVAHDAAAFSAQPGVGTDGAHHAHLCPLCRAANQVRVALTAAPHSALQVFAFQSFAIHPAPAGSARSIDPSASGPRAPPSSLSPRV